MRQRNVSLQLGLFDVPVLKPVGVSGSYKSAHLSNRCLSLMIPTDPNQTR